jgi:hypothetical protein
MASSVGKGRNRDDDSIGKKGVKSEVKDFFDHD